jgi:hypothetical protein
MLFPCAKQYELGEGVIRKGFEMSDFTNTLTDNTEQNS